ncbi:cupin-like domain-containing protein [Altererythrobacter sp. CAU 1778]
MAFSEDTLARFAEVYPVNPAKLAHGLRGDARLSLEALVALAVDLGEDSVEYNPGDLPIGIAPEDIPAAAMTPAETIRQIETAGAWMVLKRIEQVPAYRDLLEDLLSELDPVIARTTGPRHRSEGFIFISSPGSMTPFHFDPEHNILLQLRGEKTMTVFPPDDETLCSPELHERFHTGKHHRNLPWDDAFLPRGEAITIRAGEAIHVPVKAPHFVRNGSEVSVSLSITWRSAWSEAEASARGFNGLVRRLGMQPRSPAAYPASNWIKSTAYRAARRLGVTG